MNRSIAVTMAAAAILALTGGPVSADTPNCVSAAERVRVRGTHMPMRQVHVIFDVRGLGHSSHQAAEVQQTGRYYRNCEGGGSQAWIMYERRDPEGDGRYSRWYRSYSIPQYSDWQWAEETE